MREGFLTLLCSRLILCPTSGYVGCGRGLDIPLQWYPPLSLDTLFFTPPAMLEMAETLRSEVLPLIANGSVEELPRGGGHQAFFPGCFWSHHSPQCLQQVCGRPLFNMETLRCIIAAMGSGIWAASVNMKDAYFHLPIW